MCVDGRGCGWCLMIAWEGGKEARGIERVGREIESNGSRKKGGLRLERWMSEWSKREQQ